MHTHVERTPYIIEPRPRRIVAPERCRKIIMDVARARGVDTASIMDKSRKNVIARARHEIFYRLRTELGWSYPRIGRCLDSTIPRCSGAPAVMPYGWLIWGRERSFQLARTAVRECA